jgi:hypothetical protein
MKSSLRRRTFSRKTRQGGGSGEEVALKAEPADAIVPDVEREDHHTLRRERTSHDGAAIKLYLREIGRKAPDPAREISPYQEGDKKGAADD